jgi:hypothetical protein
MSERSWGRAWLGGVVGLVLGIFLGAHRVEELAAEEGTVVPGFSADPWFYLHSPRFWFVLVVCTIVFAFVAGRIGRPASHSDM